MEQDTLLPFDLPGIGRKKVSVAFDGGLLSSDGDALLLRGVERRLRIAEQLSGCRRTVATPLVAFAGDVVLRVVACVAHAQRRVGGGKSVRFDSSAAPRAGKF